MDFIKIMEKLERPDNKEIAAFERVKIARHPKRPYALDLIKDIFEDFIELHGDRRYAEDAAIVGGMARLGSFDVLVVGQQKGRDTNQRRHRNFGMPKPEGYRKALRLMRLAEKFRRPVITFIDTPGAYPGIDAEERGQAEAIAYNLREMAKLKVPTIVVILGEGGSGGALAIGIGDRIIMMENAVYSVISPEGCAAILWKDAGAADKAAACLRLTASDLAAFQIIDQTIPETVEWVFESDNAENETKNVINLDLKNVLIENLSELIRLDITELLRKRYEKFRSLGSFVSAKSL